MQIYLNYTDEILATYANAGLVRRAKKSVDSVQHLPDENSDTWRFHCEDYTVSLPASGIQDAHCTCSAHECCKHILSSVLWLQQHADLCHQSAEQTAESSAPTALDSLLALDSLSLLKKSKKADRLLAFQMVNEWQQQPESCRVEIEAATLSFHTSFSATPIRFFAQTAWEGMLSEVPEKQKNACHLACIAYVFAQHAPDKWQWTPDVSQTVHNDDAHLSEADQLFIQELQHMTLSFIRQGLAHLAQESVLALHLLNMQARAQSLPRLAAELRRLHGLLKKCLNHDIQTDEQQVFLELARFYHYLYALAHASPPLLTALKGQKRDYQAQDLPKLIPLGSEWWHTPSGARGLSVCFWDGEAQCLREVTQARANALDTTFTAVRAAQTGIWGSPLSFITQHILHLSQTKLSDNGQISPASDVKIIRSEALSTYTWEDFRAAVLAISDWQQLTAILTPTSLLNANKPRYLFLYPQDCQELTLNEWEQRFETHIRDEYGQLLRLSLPIQFEHQRKINHLDRLIKSQQIRAILVRVDAVGQHIELIPCSVLLEHHKRLQIFNLDFDFLPRPPKQTLFDLIRGRIEKMQAQKKQYHLAQSQLTPLDYILQQLQALLEFYANTGRQQFDEQDEAQWQELLHKLDAMGMTTFSNSLKQPQQDFSEQLVKTRYLLWALQQLQVQLPRLELSQNDSVYTE